MFCVAQTRVWVINEIKRVQNPEESLFSLFGFFSLIVFPTSRTGSWSPKEINLEDVLPDKFHVSPSA